MGDFFISIINLINFEVVNFNENEKFNLWEFLENLILLISLKILILLMMMFQGYILLFIGNMIFLVDFELSGNFFKGEILLELGRLKNLKLFMVYYNLIIGRILEELGNLIEFIELDMLVN